MKSIATIRKVAEIGRIAGQPDDVVDLPFDVLVEKYGDRPEWLKIAGYREEHDGTRHRRIGELMLSLRGKDYWFPVSPGVYEKFVHKAVTESRGAALRYLQVYIRAYRTYKERWPSRRYVRANRLPTASFFPD